MRTRHTVVAVVPEGVLSFGTSLIASMHASCSP
jgi:hypothetical protein